MIDPNELEPYFGWRELAAKGYEPGKHDYKPALDPIRVPLIQDLPEKFHKVQGVNTDPIDPYMIVADMRTLFESKGRRLAGFMVFPSFIKGGDGKKHSIDSHPPIHKMKSQDGIAHFGMHSMVRELGIHPLPIVHMMVWMAYFERRAQFAKLRMRFEEGVRNGDERAYQSLQNLLSVDGIQQYQWSPQQAARIMGQFPSDPIMRQMLMPPGMVSLPDEAELGWVDMERGIKHALEVNYAATGIGCDDVLVIATDMKGAIAVTSARNDYNPWHLMLVANGIFYVHLFGALTWLIKVEVEPVVNDPGEALQRVGDFMTKAYGIPILEYFGRKIPEGSVFERMLDGYSQMFGWDVVEWHKERRKEFLEIQRKNGIKEDPVMGVVDD